MQNGYRSILTDPEGRDTSGWQAQWIHERTCHSCLHRHERAGIEEEHAVKALVILMKIAVLLTLAFSSMAAVEAADGKKREPHTYTGLYRVATDHMIGVDPFIMDDGTSATLISDYSSGVVRRLFPGEADEFVMGATFNAAAPVELMVEFEFDRQGLATGMSLRAADGARSHAKRIDLRNEAVEFEGVNARLAGTLILPPTKGPHPAIVLLHGSGPLTRYSFGPYPHFFSSLGLAVLIFDKRGTGKSTGLRLDASTGAAMRDSFYPDELVGDAMAAMRFLEQRADIDRARIGFWGSSEGGMLATQVAARSGDVAFAINSSGFMEPLWQTLEYQVPAYLRSTGTEQDVIERQRAFVKLWLDVARTGEGWEDFRAAERKILESDGFWFLQSRGPFTSVEQLRWDWQHVLTFDPTLHLGQIRCPVLAVFGELDPVTPAQRAAENMRRAFERAGQKDFTIRIFPQAGHSLGVVPGNNRMAPGVFGTLRSWLRERVQPVEPSATR